MTRPRHRPSRSMFQWPTHLLCCAGTRRRTAERQEVNDRRVDRGPLPMRAGNRRDLGEKGLVHVYATHRTGGERGDHFIDPVGGRPGFVPARAGRTLHLQSTSASMATSPTVWAPRAGSAIRWSGSKRDWAERDLLLTTSLLRGPSRALVRVSDPLQLGVCQIPAAKPRCPKPDRRVELRHVLAREFRRPLVRIAGLAKTVDAGPSTLAYGFPREGPAGHGLPVA